MKPPSDLKIYFVNTTDNHRNELWFFTNEYFRGIFDMYPFKSNVDTLDKIDLWNMERNYLCLK